MGNHRDNRIRPILSPSRAAWLTQLAMFGPARRPRNRAGFDCIALGWTEWDYRTPSGEPISAEAAQAEFGEKWWRIVRPSGGELKERITEKGLSVLRESGAI